MDQNRRPTRPDDLVIDIIEPAMKVGAVCGQSFFHITLPLER